jgi:undecaprenyl diphosphate synthase
MKSNVTDIKEIEIEVKGRVQGVNFRNMIKKHADQLGLKGYVRNKQDGSVLIIAQGEEDKIDQLMSFIKNSPGFSKVENIISEWKTQKARYSAFDVIKEDGYVIDKAKSIVNLGKALVIDNKKNVPLHVVIIPDGNRRWARERGLSASFGHYTSASDERLIELMLESKNMGIKYLSFWGFSTENWKRDEREINSIFDLIFKKIHKLKELAHKHKIRFRHIGRKDRLPKKLLKELTILEGETKEYDELNVQLLLDYGGRDEIIRAVNKLIRSGVKKIDEETFKRYLDSNDIPDPDYIIRTSGEKRTSGLMPYQATYAEFYFTEVYFPEFDVNEYRKAIKSFKQRIRRFGATAKADLVKK